MLYLLFQKNKFIFDKNYKILLYHKVKQNFIKYNIYKVIL